MSKKTTFQVVEKFVSINGEGKKCGQLAVFIRMKGCNLNCSYCDTTWANEADAPFEELTAEEIVAYVKETKVKNVTLTGGEPLLQPNIKELLLLLSKEDLFIEIETNGSISIEPFCEISNRISFTLDYKVETSGMEQFMDVSNYKYIKEKDTIKFVCGNEADLLKTKEIIETYNLEGKCGLYISPQFGMLQLEEIVEFMKQHCMNQVNLQLQLHKVIWDAEERGV